MSLLDEAKMSSLKDKIREQASVDSKESTDEEKKVEVRVKKGRRLNK